MIDYLLAFPTAEARNAVFPPPEDSPWAPCWPVFETATAMPVRVIISEAVFSEDGETLISPQVLAPGVWLAIRAPERLPEVEDLLETLLCTDSELASAGLPYVHFSRLQPETILGQVTPVFAGDGYLIPAGSPASALEEWLIPTSE